MLVTSKNKYIVEKNENVTYTMNNSSELNNYKISLWVITAFAAVKKGTIKKKFANKSS